MGLNDIALTLTLGIAAFTDFREHRIYNKLLVPAFGLAILLQIYFQGWIGLQQSLFGALIGFLILLIPYLLGGMGAGDVKLLAVIGAFGGAAFVLTSFLYGALVGGIISVGLLARRGFKASKEKFPYGIAIALGTLFAMFVR